MDQGNIYGITRRRKKLTTGATGATGAAGVDGARGPAGAAAVGGGGLVRVVVNIGVNTTAAAAANTEYIYNATAAGITLTLPTAIGNSVPYTFKNSSAGTVSLAATAFQTFDGSASPIVLGSLQSLALFSDGSNWGIR